MSKSKKQNLMWLPRMRFSYFVLLSLVVLGLAVYFTIDAAHAKGEQDVCNQMGGWWNGEYCEARK